MSGEQSVRRSGRQTSATNFFVPHFDPSYETPTTTKKAPMTADTPDSSKALLKSDIGAKKRSHETNSTDSASKKQKMSKSALSGEENVSSLANENNPGSSKRKPQPAKAIALSKKNTAINKKSKEVPAGPKKRRSKLERVNDQLKALGVGPDKSHGNCARAGIYRGSIKLTGKQSDLDQVILSGTLRDCGHTCNATLGDLLRQPDYAGMDYENSCQYATVVCDEYAVGCDMGRTYVTRICNGKPYFDSGKSHNHCNRCKVFGKCIGDYREAHCTSCGRHFFAGSGGQFGCERCDGSSGDGDCVLM